MTDRKRETNKNTIIAADLSTALTVMDRLSQKKVNKEMPTLNGTLEQVA